MNNACFIYIVFTISNWLEHQPKLNEKCMLYLHCISWFLRHFFIRYSPQLLFHIVLHQLLHQQISFHFSQLVRTSFNIVCKRIVIIFLFCNGLTQNQSQTHSKLKSAKCDKIFLLMLPKALQNSSLVKFSELSQVFNWSYSNTF